MEYDFPTEADWRCGWMVRAPLERTLVGREVRAAWDFVHLVEACRWADCEYHRPVR